LPAFLVDHAAIDDPAFNGICRAAEDIGGVRRAEFVTKASCSGPRAPARHSRDARRQKLVPEAEVSVCCSRLYRHARQKRLPRANALRCTSAGRRSPGPSWNGTVGNSGRRSEQYKGLSPDLRYRETHDQAKYAVSTEDCRK
jgi:hypothetical protein